MLTKTNLYMKFDLLASISHSNQALFYGMEKLFFPFFPRLFQEFQNLYEPCSCYCGNSGLSFKNLYPTFDVHNTCTSFQTCTFPPLRHLLNTAVCSVVATEMNSTKHFRGLSAIQRKTTFTKAKLTKLKRYQTQLLIATYSGG